MRVVISLRCCNLGMGMAKTLKSKQSTSEYMLLSISVYWQSLKWYLSAFYYFNCAGKQSYWGRIHYVISLQTAFRDDFQLSVVLLLAVLYDFMCGGQLLSLKPWSMLIHFFHQMWTINLDWLVFFFLFFSPLKHCCIVEQARCFLLNSHSFLNDSIWNINLACSCCPATSSSIHSQIQNLKNYSEVSYTAPNYRFWLW